MVGGTLVVASPGVLDGDTDVDSASLTAVLVSGPSSGSLTLNSNGGYTYVPDSGFAGTDSFRYKANDGFLDSNVALVTITVVAPVLTNGSFETGDFVASVPAIPFAHYQLDHWTVTGNAAGLLSTQNCSATDGSRMAIFNGANEDFGGTITQAFTTVPGATYQLDFDAGTIASVIPKQQLLGVTVNGGSLLSQDVPLTATAVLTAQWTAKSYTFKATSATSTLTFTDKSGTLTAGLADNCDLLLDHVRVVVLSYNNPPSAIAGSATVNEDGTVDITLAGSDIDTGDTLGFAVASQPAHGSVTLLGRWRPTPRRPTTTVRTASRSR